MIKQIVQDLKRGQTVLEEVPVPQVKAGYVVIDFKKNSLNTFRLLASLQVLYGHAIAHLGLFRVPVFGDIICFFSGVPIFFTLSGFLIWHSIGHSSTFSDYAKKRFWRIYPELWVAVAVEIIVLWALYHQPINWPQLGLFTIGQATFFQFWTPDFLRGYGLGFYRHDW